MSYEDECEMLEEKHVKNCVCKQMRHICASNCSFRDVVNLLKITNQIVEQCFLINRKHDYYD